MLFFLFKKEEGREEEEDLNSQNFLLMQVGTHNYSGSSYTYDDYLSWHFLGDGRISFKMRTIKKGKKFSRSNLTKKVAREYAEYANLFANEDNGHNSCVALIPFY